jgi:hypothetical protein
VCKSWFFEKISKIDKPVANLTKMRREQTQISKIRNKKVEITTNKHQGNHHRIGNLYSNKLENLEEMNKFLGFC